MYNFCTLFDSNYLSRGLAMYESLSKVCNDFHLYIFAFDSKAYEVLNKLKLENVTVIPLTDFEDEELLKIKPERSAAEYCWTSTSSTILYVLENFNVDNCTYIDADLYFFSSPKVLFDEMGNNSIMITEHRYTPRYDKSKKSGKYCVQFVTFKNDERGLKALKWWRDRCLEWCYARYEDGKFGDQMYLDDWTTRFEGVHVLQHLGGGLAAWNIQQYEIFNIGNQLTGREVKTGNVFEVVFYHFHYLRFLNSGCIELGRRILSEEIITLLYKPYVRLLEKMKERINEIDGTFDPHGTGEHKTNWKSPILYVWRKLNLSYNIFKKEDLLEG